MGARANVVRKEGQWCEKRVSGAKRGGAKRGSVVRKEGVRKEGQKPICKWASDLLTLFPPRSRDTPPCSRFLSYAGSVSHDPGMILTIRGCNANRRENREGRQSRNGAESAPGGAALHGISRCSGKRPEKRVRSPFANVLLMHLFFSNLCKWASDLLTLFPPPPDPLSSRP